MILPGKFRQVADLVRLTRTQAKRHDESALCAVARMFYQLTAGQFSPGEIRAYAPHLNHYRKNYPVLISKQASLGKLRKINDPALQDLTEDKHVFYTRCAEHGVKTPRHLFSTQSGDPRYDRLKSASPAGLVEALPDQFIVKDRYGAYGGGFAAFRKQGDEFVSNSNEAYSGEALIALFDDPATGPLIVQERAFDHPELSALTGSQSLQCVRLVTYRDSRGAIRFLFYMIKLLAQGNIVDNFTGGRSGNLIAFGDPEGGILNGAVVGDPGGAGLQTVTEHPESGRSLNGFCIPLWQDVLDLARTAHQVFTPFRTIGWDIAVTADGPLILEGNIWYDPPLYAPHIMADEDWSLIFGQGFKVRRQV